jgi:hypothetical protein
MKSLNLMKKLMFLVLAVIAITLVSFKPSMHSLKHKNLRHIKYKNQTLDEFGEFTSGGVAYGVYGDASTETVTLIDFYFTGVPVYSFSGTIRGASPYVFANLTVYPTSTSSPVYFYGQLVFL